MKFFGRSLRKLTLKQKIAGLIVGVILIVMFLTAVMMGPFRLFFWNIPSLAGLPIPKSYLVLLQNNNELRPGGGFLSGYGVVRMTWGFPGVDFKDSYSISTSDYVNPPYPFEKLIGDDPFYTGWQFRDANFSPDFETSTKQAVAFYTMQNPKANFQAVIAMDFEVVEDLLRTIGGVEVEGELFTADNFFIKVQRSSKDIDLHDEEALENRKGILSQIAQGLVKKMIFSPHRYGSFVQVIKRNLDEKHVLLYSSKEELQSKFVARGWNGKIQGKPGEDYLHINVANIGGRKADRYVQKRYEYTVSFPYEGLAHVRLIETFTHQGGYNLQSDRYQAYVRTYVPLGSKLTRSNVDAIDQVQIEEELGATYFGNTLKMMPGERRTFIYEYDLPASVISEDYILNLSKQAGVIGDDYYVTVRMPNDYEIASEGSDEPLLIRENIATWRGDLSEDISLRVQKGADTSPPLIQWQQFRNLRTIEIRFNEDLDPESIVDISNYEIVDKNHADQVRDNIRVTQAWLDEKDLLLGITGINYVPGERYAVRLKGLRDLSGNVISPDPREITVVQR